MDPPPRASFAVPRARTRGPHRPGLSEVGITFGGWLAERVGVTCSSASAVECPRSARSPPAEADQGRVRPVVTRYCWVSGSMDFPGRWAGLVLEWRADVRGQQWRARVAHAVVGAGRMVLVEAWVPARFLEPAV